MSFPISAARAIKSCPVFRRTWWKPRRIAVASVFGAVAILAAVWLSGSETIEDGEPWEQANEKMLKMGGEDATYNCGRFAAILSKNGQRSVNKNTYFNMPDGSVIMLLGHAESEDDPVLIRVISITRDGHAFWNEPKSESEYLPQYARRHSLLYPLRLIQWNLYGSKR